MTRYTFNIKGYYKRSGTHIYNTLNEVRLACAKTIMIEGLSNSGEICKVDDKGIESPTLGWVTYSRYHYMWHTAKGSDVFSWWIIEKDGSLGPNIGNDPILDKKYMHRGFGTSKKTKTSKKDLQRFQRIGPYNFLMEVGQKK